MVMLQLASKKKKVLEADFTLLQPQAPDVMQTAEWEQELFSFEQELLFVKQSFFCSDSQGVAPLVSLHSTAKDIC